MDVALSHAILEEVAAGGTDGVLRIHVPGRVLAFGRADHTSAGYEWAQQAAVAHGYEPVERLAGGRAAVFHLDTLAFSMAIPAEDPRSGIHDRFSMVAGLMMEAFRSLGVDARIGEVPGEYCPGSWSVNVAGRMKVMGVGQRLVRGAAHIGGVVVVDDADAIRDVLIPVYRALAIDWDPRTAGSLADRSPGLDTGVVEQAIIEGFSARFDLAEDPLPSRVYERAPDLVSRHLTGGGG